MSTFTDYHHHLPSSDHRPSSYYYPSGANPSDSPSTLPRTVPVPESTNANYTDPVTGFTSTTSRYQAAQHQGFSPYATMSSQQQSQQSSGHTRVRIPSDDGFNQWIDMTNSPAQGTHHISALGPVPEASPSTPAVNTSSNYQLRNGVGATPSSFGSSSYSSDLSPDINGGNNTPSPHSLPTYAGWSGSHLGPFQPSSSAPAYAVDEYLVLQHSPANTDFFNGMASLGLDKGSGVSPREVMSATVVDGDDFNSASPSAGAGDFGFAFAPKFGLASSYPGYATDAQQEFFTSPTYGSFASASLFGPSQYGVEAEKLVDGSHNHNHNEPSHSPTSDAPFYPSPASTIRQRRSAQVNGMTRTRPSLMTSLTTGGAPWCVSAKAAPTTATSVPKVLFASSAVVEGEGMADAEGEVVEDREHEHDNEDDEVIEDDSDDEDYIESPAHHAHHHNATHHSAGPHRTSRRMSHSAAMVPSQHKTPRRGGSPYSRPTGRRMSHSDAQHASAPGKKVKAVKWESTKPKYWVPEGFDPWWDQKSRGRGVATVETTSQENMVDETAAWPANFLPEDWKELVRGKGNSSRPFVCPAVNCGKTFQRSEHAKRHAWSLHTPDAVKVSCPYEGCDHKSTRGDNLKQHIGSHKRKNSGLALGLLRDGGASGGKRRKAKFDAGADDEGGWP